MVFSCFRNESLRRDGEVAGDYQLKLQKHLLQFVHSTPLNILVWALRELGLDESCKRFLTLYEEFLHQLADRGWAIILHPDIIEDFTLWRPLGRAVCIENMDKRKEVGRTASQLRSIFEKLPDATFCFDIGHARQVDPTMQEAESFLTMFHDRLRQIHMSYVNSQSRHERLNFESIRSFQRVAHWLSASVPIILETPVDSGDVDEEIDAAVSVFSTILCNAPSNQPPTNRERF